MEELIERAVERAITYMHDNLGEQITIDDVARRAMFSKFYFTRFFQRVTGLSPGRFLSAIRIQQAKELLLSTGLTVTDVSYRVGYNSIGTFSSRFRESVGLSPTAYRHQRGLVDRLPGEVGVDEIEVGEPDGSLGTVRGELCARQADLVGSVFIGLFPGRLPHGKPVRCMVRQEPGSFLLDNVPPGRWYLIANAAPGHMGLVDDDEDNAGYVAVQGPVTVRRDTDVRLPDLWLRKSSVFDPPVLLARLDERSVASRTVDMAGRSVKYAA